MKKTKKIIQWTLMVLGGIFIVFSIFFGYYLYVKEKESQGYYEIQEDFDTFQKHKKHTPEQQHLIDSLHNLQPSIIE